MLGSKIVIIMFMVVDMYSITKAGVCAKHLCVIDEVNNTVSTTEDGLVFDFSDRYGWSFKTGSGCTFNTGYGCTFNTGSGCTFKTGYSCTFNTGSECTFNTADGCTFKTSSECTFNTGYHCTFNTGSGCTFNTSAYCTFNTGSECTFKVGDNCSLIRYDLKGVVELMSGVTVRLTDVGYEYNRDEYIETMSVNEERLVFKLSNEEWVNYENA